MSVIKEAKSDARQELSRAIDDMNEYWSELESDEHIGPMFDGSTFAAELALVIDRLNEASVIFDRLHKTDHFGLSLRGG